MLLIKIIGDDAETGAGGHPGDHTPPHGNRPQWMRVLAMEIMRGYVKPYIFFLVQLMIS
jgi:hypothetical protein